MLLFPSKLFSRVSQQICRRLTLWENFVCLFCYRGLQLLHYPWRCLQISISAQVIYHKQKLIFCLKKMLQEFRIICRTYFCNRGLVAFSLFRDNALWHWPVKSWRELHKRRGYLRSFLSKSGGRGYMRSFPSRSGAPDLYVVNVMKK